MASTAGPAAAGEAILRDQIRTDAHGVEQAHAAKVRRARRLAELQGVEPQRVYRVDPGMDPAAYDPKELYLHLRDAHDLRLDAARKAPYAPPAPTVTAKAASGRVRLATAAQVGHALRDAARWRRREAALGVPAPASALDGLRHAALDG